MQMTAFLSHSTRRCLAFVATALLMLVVGCSTEKIDKDDKLSTEKLYEEARDEASNSNWERAAQLYEKLEARTAGTPLAQQSQIDLAYAQYKSGEKAKALATLERFIKLHPSSPGIDYAYYLQGLTNFNDNIGILGSLARQDLSERDQQASRDAYQSFRQVVTRFPASKYAPDSQLRMNYIVNALAAYEIHVARYYYRRGAYVASANRAQQVVKEFETSPPVEEALYIMVRSYDMLGLEVLRDDAERVLAQNFPDSRYLKDGFVKPDKAWWQIW